MCKRAPIYMLRLIKDMKTVLLIHCIAPSALQYTTSEGDEV